MLTVGEILKKATDFLSKKGILAPRRSAEVLLSHVLKTKRLDLYLKFDQPLEELEVELMREYLKRRSQSEPVEYILGEVDFLGAQIEVNRWVLIPRPETEILVDLTIKKYLKGDLKGKKALDLCCGSGCIGISLKLQLPDLEISASDISQEALEVAKKNAQRNRVNISFYPSDLLEDLKGKKWDFIFCNPPYISSLDMGTLSKDVMDFEPRLALDGGEEGLSFYKQLARCAPSFLAPKGKMFFEIGHTQGRALMELFSAPCWKYKKLECDYSGKDRFFFLEFE